MSSRNAPEVICYLSGIVDDGIKRERSIEFNNSAAENKVLGICNALKSRVKHVLVISTGRGGSLRRGDHFPAVARRVSGIPILYGSFWHIPFMTHVITVFSLVMLLRRLIKLAGGKQVSLIAYNRKWHYFPILCFARLLDVRCYLDLEDGSMIRTGSARSRFVSLFSRWVFDHLCNQGAMLASSLLSDQVTQKKQLVCHGVAYKRSSPLMLQPKVGLPVRILFGGSLLKETGVHLLIDCVHLLEREHQYLKGRIKIVVTGFGEMADDLQRLSLHEGRDWIEYHGSVDMLTYRSLLTGVHVGLCLKLPSSEMCSTTFPSKVVEYASFGKAVLTTRIEDVVNLFGEDGAFYVQDESAVSLVNVLRSIALDAKKIDAMAEKGQKILLKKTGCYAVAESIIDLLTVGKH